MATNLAWMQHLKVDVLKEGEGMPQRLPAAPPSTLVEKVDC